MSSIAHACNTDDIKKDKSYSLSTRTERQNIDPLEVSTDRPLIWAAYSEIHL